MSDLKTQKEALELMDHIEGLYTKAKQDGKITTKFIDALILGFYDDYEVIIRRALSEPTITPEEAKEALEAFKHILENRSTHGNELYTSGGKMTTLDEVATIIKVLEGCL